MVTDGDNQVEDLISKLIHRFGATLVINISLFYDLLSKGINRPSGFGAGTEGDPFVPTVVVDNRLSHLAAGRVACAEEKHLFSAFEFIIIRVLWFNVWCNS